MDNLKQERQAIEQVSTDYLVFLRTYSHLESKLIISEDRLIDDSDCWIIKSLSNNSKLPEDVRKELTDKLSQWKKSCQHKDDCFLATNSDWDFIPF